ncbi:MAG: hypothetical protein NTW87_03005 [Planctomycetota bacterium]|nr:hypothetical protein [Planctomycetota bacterium]
MAEAQTSALIRAEQAVERVVRTRGKLSQEYMRALREYQALIHKAAQADEPERQAAS